MLRSGGNSRAKVPERLVLPRVVDVLEAARRLSANNGRFIKMAQQEGWAPEDTNLMKDWGMVGADLADTFCHSPRQAGRSLQLHLYWTS